MAGYFTAAEAARISRVPVSTLHRWRRTGVIVPSQRSERPSLYSFEDLRDLRVAQELRERGAHPLRVAMSKVFRDLGAGDGGDIHELRPAPRVSIRPDVRGGTPVVEGTRVPTRVIAELVHSGTAEADILRMYPAISSADVGAAVAWEDEPRPAASR